MLAAEEEATFGAADEAPVAGELAGFEGGVGAVGPRVRGPVVEPGVAVEAGGEAGNGGLEAGEGVADPTGRRRAVRTVAALGCAVAPAGEDGEEAGAAPLVDRAAPGVNVLVVEFAVPAVVVGEVAAELEEQLRVGAHPKLLDAAALACSEARAVEVDPAQRGEREAEDDDFGAGLGRRAGEGERVAGATAAQAGERGVELQRPGREAVGEAPGDLVVAAVDVEAFVGFGAEGAELEQHRDRREAVGVEPVLLRHQLFGGAPEEVVGAIREGLGEPLGGGFLVELAGGAGRPVPGEAADPAGVGVGAFFEQVLLAEDLGEVPHLAAEDEPRRPPRRAPRRRGEVVQREPELLRQRPDPVLGGVDELAAVLGGLAGGELARGPAAAADPVRVRLIQRRSDPPLVQPIGAGQPREPRAHDRHPHPVPAATV